MGHDVDVLHFELEIYKNNNPRETKCNLIPVGNNRSKDQAKYYIFSSWDIYKTIKREVVERDIDVIVTANILPAFIANFCGKPVVHDYLDHWEESATVCYSGTLKERFVRDVVKLISNYNVRHAHEVITVTEELRDIISSRVYNPPYITVIPNGTDTSRLVPIAKPDAKTMIGLKEDEIVIGYVGSLEDWVSLEPVIRGMRNINGKLLIVGAHLYSDDYFRKLKDLARDIGVENKVIFTGFIDYDRLSPYLSAMDIGVNPLKNMIKNKYSAGGKVFNYLSCETPVLSTDVTSLRRMFSEYEINDRGVYFYDNLEDGRGFSAAVNDLMENYSYLNRGNFRNIAMKYDWTNLAKYYLDVLHYADINNYIIGTDLKFKRNPLVLK
jgi:glycosyltransferase involved in cell wall biosynthesis